MITQAETVRGKVASVLNSREVAINRGSVDGVALGMKFNILSSNAFDIKDPDTGESLGIIQKPKFCVRVTSVYDRMCVAATFNKYKVNVGGNGVGMGIFTPPRWVERYERLNANDASPDDDDPDSYVSVGDAVEQTDESAEPDSAKTRTSFPMGRSLVV